MKYLDASAVLRVVFLQPGPTVDFAGGGVAVSSRLIEVETFRAIDRARLLGHLDDRQTAIKRTELAAVLARLDLMAVDDAVIDRAKSSFAVNVRALDAIHVASAEILRSVERRLCEE